MRHHKLRRDCCQESIRCAAPESTNGLSSNKFERHFAARTPIGAQTPICSQNAYSLPMPVCSPNDNLQPKRQFAAQCQFAADCHFAAQTLICILKAFSQPKRISAAPSACIPEVRPRIQCRACCQASLRCAALKNPKGLFATKQMRSGPANTAAPVAQNISLLVLVCVWLTDMVCVLRN